VNIRSIMQKAYEKQILIPAFNIPYIPMMEPVARALKDTGTFGLIAVARLEWEKFESGSLEAIAEEYEKQKVAGITSLHLDHTPVIDEDNLQVDYLEIIRRALACGYDSVMVDGSRLELAGNIEATRKVVELAAEKGVPVEGELGAVLGHEEGPLPPYEELFESGKGFTDADEADRFCRESGVDWLSVAVGNIHGAISPAARDKAKVEARLNVDHLQVISKRVAKPLVLHGGTGIKLPYLKQGVQAGIAKLNIGTGIRKAYEGGVGESVERGRAAVYDEVIRLIDDFEIRGSAARLQG
jgi:fructose-bisphosphate aldolase, class II